MPKYALRYAPLFILALLLIPVNIYFATGTKQHPTPLSYQFSSSFRPGTTLYSVARLSSSEAWAVGGSFGLQCEVQDKTRCLAIPISGTILHYRENAWGVSGDAQKPLFSVSLDSPHDGWAVGYLGTLVHYDGNNWSTVPGPVQPTHFNQSLYGVAMLSPSDGWAVGNSGSILHYNGKQWMQVASPTSFDLRSIAMPSPQEGWAVGVNGTILHYHDGAWYLSNSPIKDTLNNVSMLSPNEGWAVGEQDTILHYRAEDGIWEQVISNPKLDQSTNLYGVAMSSVRVGWIIGAGRLLTYQSETWTAADNLPTISVKTSNINLYDLNLYSITLSPVGEGWAVGSTNNAGLDIIVILHYQGGTWSLSLTV